MGCWRRTTCPAHARHAMMMMMIAMIGSVGRGPGKCKGGGRWFSSPQRDLLHPYRSSESNGRTLYRPNAEWVLFVLDVECGALSCCHAAASRPTSSRAAPRPASPRLAPGSSATCAPAELGRWTTTNNNNNKYNNNNRDGAWLQGEICCVGFTQRV